MGDAMGSWDPAAGALPTLRRPESGGERVFHLRDAAAYRAVCERLRSDGFDFPDCLSGVDMEWGLRSVLHVRRLADGARATVWMDVPYDDARVPSVTDLWSGVEWHERESYDLLGIRYDGHPDLRRILLEDHWTIHPLQRRYDTGGYRIPEWQPKPMPDWDALDREREAAEAKAREAEAAKQRAAEAAKAGAASAAGESPSAQLADVKSLNANFVAKLQDAGVTTVAMLAALEDDALEALAAKVGLRSPAAVRKWRDGARELLAASPAPDVPTADPAADGGADEAVDSPVDSVVEPVAGEAGRGAALELTDIKSLNANFASKLREAGIDSVERVAALGDEELEPLAAKVGLKSPAAVRKWREGARALVGDASSGSDDGGGDA